MAKYLNPKNDLLFKLIFGTHKNLCISLLNSMLPFDEDRRVVDITYNPSELLPEIKLLKDSIVDVRCTDTLGRNFIVEMQMYWTDIFKQRILLYASKMYISQLEVGKTYDTLEPVYALTFVDQKYETAPELKDEYLHHYKIVNIEHTEHQIKGLEFVFVELPKFTPQNRAEKKLHELWMRFLTEIDESTEQVPQELLENEDIKEAVSYTEKAAYSKAQLEYYDACRDRALKERSALADALNQGKREGRQEGIAEGRAEGIAEGRAEGRAEGERVEKINVARKAKLMGLSNDEIHALTGITDEEISNL